MSDHPAADDALIKDMLIEAEEWQTVPNLKSILQTALDASRTYVMDEEGVEFMPQCEVSLVLTNDDAVRALNASHRGKNTPTNVLSFPIDEDAPICGPMLGDIVFAYQTVERESEDLGIAIQAHITHLCIHGFLHLLGFDHIETDEAEKMEAVEIAIMARLGLSNPYENTEPLAIPN